MSPLRDTVHRNKNIWQRQVYEHQEGYLTHINLFTHVVALIAIYKVVFLLALLLVDVCIRVSGLC